MRAVKIFAAERPADCPVVVARNLGRAEEHVKIINLDNFEPNSIDMLTLVVIGGRKSRAMETGDGRRVYTPRGYGADSEPKPKHKQKYKYKYKYKIS